MSSSSSNYVVPVGETEYFYPRSQRRIRKNHKGEIIYDSNNDKKK
jgi:hypothetical protein